jgi:hypothetical protein
MSKFRIKVARIEATTRGGPVCVTFQVERGTVGFQVPIRLSVSDYDDTEMVQVARSMLHGTFAELAAQSRDWKLSAKDLRQLSRMSLRPMGRPAERAGERSRQRTPRAKSPKSRPRLP